MVSVFTYMEEGESLSLSREWMSGGRLLGDLI